MAHSSGPTISQINVALSRLERVILETLDFEKVVQNVVDSIFQELGYLDLEYNIAVLALVDEEKKVLKRISISQTKQAELGVKGLPISFHSLDIPLTEKENFSIKAIKSKKIYITHDWADILRPVVDKEEARKLQESVGIRTSMIFPLIVHSKSIGIMIFSTTKQKKLITDSEKELLLRFTNLVGLAVQNSKLYSSVEEKSEDLKIANLKLKQLDKLKDEFVSIASHELRTPLTVIRSYVELLITGKAGKLNTKQYEYLERVSASSNRLANLVNTMLDLSRIESGRIKLVKEDVDITDLVNEVVAEMKAKAEEQKIDLTVTGFDERVVLIADKERIREVMINLVGNALKYTPTGGSVGIHITLNEKEIAIAIKDTGIGISKANMCKLFKKFGIIGSEYSVKKGITSTGLGLYLSQQLVQLHGGKIWAESEGEGMGSTFTFSLPIEK